MVYETVYSASRRSGDGGVGGWKIGGMMDDRGDDARL